MDMATITEICHGNYSRMLPWQLLQKFAIATTHSNYAHGNYYRKFAMATTHSNYWLCISLGHCMENLRRMNSKVKQNCYANTIIRCTTKNV